MATKVYPKVKFFGLAIWFSFSCVAHAASSLDLEKAMHAFCQGRESLALSLLEGDLDGQSFETRKFAIRIPAGRARERARLFPLLKAPEQLGDRDRLIAALLLFLGRSEDLKQMESLLATESEDKNLDALRRALLKDLFFLEGDMGAISSGERENSNELDTRDPDAIVRYLSWARVANVQISGEVLSSISSSIAKLAEDDQRKGVAEAALEKSKNGYLNTPKVLHYLESSYRICPRSAEIAQEFGFALYQQRHFAEAKDVLVKIIDHDPDSYSPHIDLWLADIFSHEGKVESEGLFLERARVSKVYFSKFELGRMIDLYATRATKLQSEYEKDKNVRLWMLIIAVSLASISGFWLGRKF